MHNEITNSPDTSSQAGSKRAERIHYPEHPLHRRIRTLSTLMDNSIVLPSGYRIGLDPILGLLPGVGDLLGALISCYLVYLAARLGLRKRVLARMFGNILIESLAGVFPLLGDVFDAVWKANIRNLRLVDQHYHPLSPERPAGRIAGYMLLIVGALTLILGTAFFMVVQFLLSVGHALFGN
jgi:hypothetical protein